MTLPVLYRIYSSPPSPCALARRLAAELVNPSRLYSTRTHLQSGMQLTLFLLMVLYDLTMQQRPEHSTTRSSKPSQRVVNEQANDEGGARGAVCTVAGVLIELLC